MGGPQNPQSTIRNPQLGRRGSEGRAHRGHHRPPQRGEVDAVQSTHRGPGCDRGRSPGRHARSALRRGGVERTALLAGGHGRDGAGRARPAQPRDPDAGRGGGGRERCRVVPRRRGRGGAPRRCGDRPVPAESTRSGDPGRQQGRPAAQGHAAPRVLRHGGSPQAQQGRGRHRVLLDAPHLAGHRARRRVRAGGGREGRDARAGPEDRQRRLGAGCGHRHRREQVGPDRGEGYEHGGARRAGAQGARAVPPVHPVSLRVRQDGSAGHSAARVDRRGRRGTGEAGADGGGEPRARDAAGTAAAAATGRRVGAAALRLADRHRAAAVRHRVEPPGGGARIVHALPPERLPGGVGVHGLAREHQVPPQAGDGPPVNDFGLGLMLLLAYLIGATPTSYIAGKLGRGIDLRAHGSKNLGATNVYRVLGWKYAIPVGVVDVAKGAVPVTILGPWSNGPAWFTVALGIAAVLGHMFSPYVRFRGGKGVATAAGMFLALAPLAVLISLPIWGATLWLSGYVSVASIAVAVLFPLWVRVTAPAEGEGEPSTFWASVVLALLIVYSHRANIRRLMDGTENRFRTRKGVAA